jgi:hypothetical protein
MEEYLDTMASLINDYGQRRNAVLAISVRRLARELASYLRLRHSTSSYMIERRRATVGPKGWTARDEEIWQEWLDYTFNLESWTTEVLQPLFGTDVHSWEIGDWRLEVFTYLKDWIQRDMVIVDNFDMTPEEPVVEVLYDGLDPYMVEHGMIKGLR